MRIISNAERNFIRAIVSRGKRLDGRKLLDGRSINIKFRKEWGGCIVYLGNTAVFAQVSAKVTQPKPGSPVEGILNVNFDVSPMSAPHTNLSRSSNEFVDLHRSLERCIQESKCLDLESLCIVAGVKVWNIRVDIRAMNDDGNVLGCSSIAAVSALAHFRRPDVTVVGTEVTVHPIDDRQPVPLSLHHMPVVINMAVFNQRPSPFMVVDPTETEERIADGCYIIGMNDLQEICMIHRRGSFALSEVTIEKCVKFAAGRAQNVIQAIRAAVSKSNAILCP